MSENGKENKCKAPTVNTQIISQNINGYSDALAKTKKGNRLFLTFLNVATRYPEAFALKSCVAEIVEIALIELFSRVGIPNVILTDQWTNFITSKLRSYMYLHC